MIGKLCTFVLAALGLLALAGCGTDAQPTAQPTVTAAPAVTRTGTVAMSGTPLAMATSTGAATPAGTVPAAGATATSSTATTPAMTPAITALPTGTTGAVLTPAATSTGGAVLTPAATGTVPTGGLAPPEGTPSVSATNPAAPAAATSTVPTGGLEPPEGTPAVGTTTPAATPTGVEVVVTGFNVWQDFMPGTNPGGPPLYASVELNITNHGPTPVHAVLATRIIVRRPEGDVLLDRGLQGGPPDTVAGTDLAPGETRHYSYRSASSDVSPTMTENEAVSGSLTVSLDSVEQTVPLPATRVLFTQ